MRAAEPQLVTEPETVNEPVARSITEGPQFLVTWMQAWLVTVVTQRFEKLVTFPPQTLRPYYVWSNLFNGLPNNRVRIGSGTPKEGVAIIGPYFMIEGRDVTNAVPADFAELEYPHPMIRRQPDLPPVPIPPQPVEAGSIVVTGKVGNLTVSGTIEIK